jgi:hypothetical protein
LIEFLFSWTIDKATPPTINTTIVQCLSGLPGLVDLEIESRYGIFPCLIPFKRLRRLWVLGIGGGYDGLSTIVSNCPDLSELNVGGQIPVLANPIPPLPDIFTLVPSGRTMNIQSLGLSWFQIRVGPDILRHLRSLESFRLYHHMATSNRSREPLYDITAIWRSFRDSGVTLRHLDVDYVDGALLDYLSSARSLKSLRIAVSYPRGGEFPADIAYRFFTLVLPRHAQSLKTLSILVPTTSEWCVHTHYLSSLMRCEKLETMSLSIALWRNPDSDSPGHTSDIVSSKFHSEVYRFDGII